MDRKFTKHYRKLRVNRKNPRKESTAVLKRLTTTADENQSKNSGHFKIERFMEDVKRFGKESTVEESTCGRNEQPVRKNKSIMEGKDKRDEEEKRKQNKVAKEKVGHSSEKYPVNRREGLFQKGLIITKDFNKGLAPTISARLNEDLLKMIKLANGKHYKTLSKKQEDRKFPRGLDGEVWNKFASFTGHSIEPDPDNEVSSNKSKTSHDFVNDKDNVDNRSPKDNHNKVEAEVQVSSTQLSRSRAQSDLYLEFTHYVTRSLFNTDINKAETKAHSDDIKESLIKIYHERLKKCSVQKNLIPAARTSSSSLLQHDSDKMELSEVCTPVSTNRNNNTCTCPSTSKSEEGPVRKKFIVQTDCQLSDDIVIRKTKTLYTSGLDYLKAVYGSSSTSHKASVEDETNILSPVQQNSCNSSVNYNHNYSTNNSDIDEDLNTSNNFGESSQLNDSFNLKTDKDEMDNSCNFYEAVPLQYFPGCCKNKYSLNDKNNNILHQHTNVCSNVEESNEPKLRINESPGYISLLPPSIKLNQNFSSNFLYGLNSTEKMPRDGSGDSVQVHSMLTLPIHLPPRKSPDIQYLPRKMF